jgi:hypothetical protein
LQEMAEAGIGGYIPKRGRFHIPQVKGFYFVLHVLPHVWIPTVLSLLMVWDAASRGKIHGYRSAIVAYLDKS